MSKPHTIHSKQPSHKNQELTKNNLQQPHSTTLQSASNLGQVALSGHSGEVPPTAVLFLKFLVTPSYLSKAAVYIELQVEIRIGSVVWIYARRNSSILILTPPQFIFNQNTSLQNSSFIQNSIVLKLLHCLIDKNNEIKGQGKTKVQFVYTFYNSSTHSLYKNNPFLLHTGFVRKALSWSQNITRCR